MKNSSDIGGPQMNAQPFWFVAVMDDLPEDTFKKGLVLQEGFPEDEEYNIKEVQYMILLRTKAITQDEAHRLIQETIKEWGSVEPKELLIVGKKFEDVSKSEQKVVSKLKLGEVSAKARFIGFNRNCSSAREQAISIIEMAIARDT